MNLIPYCRLDDIPPSVGATKGGHRPTVYLITNSRNGEMYVGHTSAHLSIRLRDHRTLLLKNRHHSAGLQNAINYYGLGAFYAAIIVTTETVEEALDVEQQFIDVIGTKYNNCPTARSCKGRKMKESVRRSIMARSGRVYCRNNNTWYDSVSIAAAEGAGIQGVHGHIRNMLKKYRVFETVNGVVLTTDPEYLEKVLAEWGSVSTFARFKYGEYASIRVYDYDSDSVLADRYMYFDLKKVYGAGTHVSLTQLKKNGGCAISGGKFLFCGEFNRDLARRAIEAFKAHRFLPPVMVYNSRTKEITGPYSYADLSGVLNEDLPASHKTISQQGYATQTGFYLFSGQFDEAKAARLLDNARMRKQGFEVVVGKSHAVGRFDCATGDLITVYSSLREACRFLESKTVSSLRKALASKTKFSFGYLWARMRDLPDGCTRLEVPERGKRKVFKRAAHEGTPVVRCEETGEEYCHFSDVARGMFGNENLRVGVRCAALAKRKYKGYTFTLIGELANGNG